MVRRALGGGYMSLAAHIARMVLARIGQCLGRWRDPLSQSPPPEQPFGT